MLFTTRWAEELADGNRMAVKEKRALADGVLTPFCVFVFWRGKKGRESCKTAGLCSKVPKYLFSCLFYSHHLLPFITYHRGEIKRETEDKRKNSVNMYNYKFTTL